MFGDDTVAAAMIDRLVHHADVLSTNGTQTVLGGRCGTERAGLGWFGLVGWFVEWDP
ncbi:ATP-binding protein [Streptomyces mirabilis]|uniref:ATP-binding protein n=1 Tax=Streptomyces mirabilis TaxID=68239 RepID=UPI0037D9EE16